MCYKMFAMKMWEILEKKYLTKSIESRLLLKRRFYRFQLKGLPIAEHINDYTKLLTDLINVDVGIEEENKALILMIPDEKYKIIVFTLVNAKQSLNYNDVSTALINYEVRRKDKQSSSNGTSAEALMVKSKGSNQKGKGARERSKSRPGFRDLNKNQCAFCKEIRH